MTPINQTALDSHFEEEKKQTELFSDIDLQEFNNLITDDADFKILLEWLKNTDILTAIDTKWGLKTTIDTEIGKNKDQADIFDKEYSKLTLTQMNLYEVCVLWAMLQNETDKKVVPEYKTLAKEYYETINPKKVETKVETPKTTITEECVTAEADIDQSTQTEIETTITKEAINNKNITEASITVSAGADIRKMDVTKAKEKIHNKKKDLMKTLAKKFTGDNLKQINNILMELYGEDADGKVIEGKSQLQKKIDKDPTQEGNYYLISARVAEGFIKTLNKLTLKDPEPKLTLDIDRDKCLVGTGTTNNGDIAADRKITIDVSVIVAETGTTQTVNTAPVDTDTTPSTSDTSSTVVSTTTWTQTSNPYPSAYNDEDMNNNLNVTNTVFTNVDVAIQPNAPVADVETPEIISIKKEIYEHFQIDGKDISREIDISNNIVYKDGIYTVAIKWYSGLEFAYDAKKKTIEVKANTGGVRKGLFLYDVTNQSVAIDKTDKKNIVPTFDSTKTIESINKQLETNDKDEDKKADYKVKKIAGSTLEFEYGVSFMKDKADKTKYKKDTFMLELDTENNLVTPDSQGEGQVSQRKKITGTVAEDTDFVLDGDYQREADEKGYNIFYYLQTKVNTNGVPELNIINSIQKNNATTKTYESIYTEHKEMTTREFDEIKKDFINNKIERTFEGSLNDGHSKDFKDNRKITKGAGVKGYNFSIYFTKNDGTQQQVDIPFTMTIENNAMKYSFTNKGKKQSVSIDNIIYDINTPDKADGAPSIKMIENQEQTLIKAKEKTSDKIFSDIFSGEKTKRGNDINNNYEVKAPAFSLGNIEFNTDNKWGYKRTIFFGEQKDDIGNILLTGEEKGTIYYDQEYKIIAIKIKVDEQEKELDFSNTKEEVKMDKVLEDINGTEKWIVLSPSIVKDKNNKTSLQLNFKTPEETDKNRKTSDLYLDRIRTERKTIFTALKQLNIKKEFPGDVFILPSIANADETKFDITKIAGPDGKWLYKRQLAKAGEKWREKYIEQNIYCKVVGTDVQLCDSDGNKIEQMYVLDYKNEIYYKITVNETDKSTFDAVSLDKIKMQDVAKLETEEITYKNDKVNIELKNENVALLKSNYKDSYTFSNNGYEMCTINVKDGELDESALEVWASKKPQIIKSKDVLFGSYKKYFAGEGRENLGIGENDYETAFKAIYEDKYSAQDANKKIVQVKLRSTTDKKYYYDYMAINTKGNAKFSLEKLEGLEEAKEEIKRRLDNLVLLNKIEPSTKWDTLRWVKINKDKTTWAAYLKDKTSPVKITLTDSNNKTSDPIEITLKDKQKWELANKELSIGKQKVNCSLEFKDNISLLNMDVIEQENENQ